MELLDDLMRLPQGARVLVIAPGPHGLDFLRSVEAKENWLDWAIQYGGELRFGVLSSPLFNSAKRPSLFFEGRATQLPFRRNSFDAILSWETLLAVQPSWTVFAEFHRVLIPEGRLILIEPARGGLNGSLVQRLIGLGPPCFTRPELEGRLARADFAIDRTEDFREVPGYPNPAFGILAIKKEGLATPLPSITTGRELKAKQRPYPKGEELP